MNAVESEDYDRSKHLPVRVFGVMFPNHLHPVTTTGSGIRTTEDLQGKRISTGDTPGSAIEDRACRALMGVCLGRAAATGTQRPAAP